MIYIVKGDGTREPFEPQKLEDSLVHAGASFQLARDITTAVEHDLRDGMNTNEIYRNAFKLLRHQERPVAARYSMRRAILDLGPTGFPFEDFVAELFRAKDYDAKARVIVQGKCVEHEVDVIATSKTGGPCIGAELKFHNKPGYKTDVKIPLYVQARFEDIQAGAKARGGECPIDAMWLITNTKFTSQAIQYGECAGLHLISWEYPKKGNLSDMVRETGLYPITALTTLNKAEKDRLLMHRAAFCRNVVQDEAALAAIGIPEKKRSAVLAESRALCGV